MNTLKSEYSTSCSAPSYHFHFLSPLFSLTLFSVSSLLSFSNSTSTVKVLWALHSSDSVKRKGRLDWRPSSSGSDGTLQIRRPAGERTAPFGPSSSWKRSAEPSGSDAANWKTKFSPANVRSSLWGRWKAGSSLTEDRGGKLEKQSAEIYLFCNLYAIIFQSSNELSLCVQIPCALQAFAMNLQQH